MTICLHDFVTGALQQNHYCCHACALVQDSELPFVKGMMMGCLDEFVAGILQKNHCCCHAEPMIELWEMFLMKYFISWSKESAGSFQNVSKDMVPCLCTPQQNPHNSIILCNGVDDCVVDHCALTRPQRT